MYNYKDIIEHFSGKATELLKSNELNRAQRSGIRNLMANFSPTALLKREFGRMKYGVGPDGFVISLTNWCNLNCRYCYSSSSSKNRISVDEAKFDIILKELSREFGIRFVVVTGGEPIPLLIKIAEKYKDHIFYCYTNGSFLDRMTCNRLKELGNIIPAITLLGNKEIHDNLRGVGNYDEIMRAVVILNELNLIWGFSIIENAVNFDTIIQDEFLEKITALKPYFLRMIPYMPIGRGEDEKYILKKEQKTQLSDVVIKLRDQYGIFAYDYINDRKNSLTCLAGGKKTFYVNEKMQLSPCVFMDTFIDIEFKLDENKSNLIDLLRDEKLFMRARSLAEKYPKCPILCAKDWKSQIYRSRNNLDIAKEIEY